VLQHAGTRESGGMPSPGKFLKIDAKILQFRDISTYMKCFYSAIFNMLLQHVFIERFLSVEYFRIIYCITCDFKCENASCRTSCRRESVVRE